MTMNSSKIAQKSDRDLAYWMLGFIGQVIENHDDKYKAYQLNKLHKEWILSTTVPKRDNRARPFESDDFDQREFRISKEGILWAHNILSDFLAEIEL
jgi:hypothetical protein